LSWHMLEVNHQVCVCVFALSDDVVWKNLRWSIFYACSRWTCRISRRHARQQPYRPQHPRRWKNRRYSC